MTHPLPAISLLAFLSLAAPAPALAGGAPTVVQVPADVPTIQAGIELVAPEGEVIVDVGVYPEQIDFGGKALTLRSTDPSDPLVVAATLLDGTAVTTSVVICENGEGPGTVLDGFTITHGTGSIGGGMRIDSASPLVRRCVFLGNVALQGGGLYAVNSLAVLRNCTFEGNKSAGDGGGIYARSSELTVIGCVFRDNDALTGGGMYHEDSGGRVVNTRFLGNRALTVFAVAAAGGGMANFDSAPTLANCLFAGNLAQGLGFGGGGGIYNRDSDPLIANTTFSGNQVQFPGDASGLYSRGTSNPTLANCIVWGNGPSPVVDAFGAVTAASFSDVQGGWFGLGNVDVDPLFVDPDGADDTSGTVADNDYRLAPGSPLIDAGNSLTVPDGARLDLDWNPRFVADPATPDTGFGGPGVVDMGPYEYQPPIRLEVLGLPTGLAPL